MVGAALLALLLCSWSVLFSRAVRVTELLDDIDDADAAQSRTVDLARWARGVLYGAAIAAIFYSAAYAVGSWFPALTRRSEWSLADMYSSTADQTRSLSAWMLMQLVPILIVSFVATHELDRFRSSRDGWAVGALPLAVMLALAAPPSGNGALRFGGILPLWLLSMVVLWWGFRNWLGRSAMSCTDSREGLLAAARPPSVRRTTISPARHKRLRRLPYPADLVIQPPAPRRSAQSIAAGYRLLSLGPRESPMANGLFAARYAGYVAVVPVAYFLWTTLGELPQRIQFGPGALAAATGLITEASRWIVNGFVFGYLYPKMPGRTGPEKALVMAGLWVLAGLVPALVMRAVAHDNLQSFIYRGAQTALFLIVLAIMIDLATLRTANGSWRDLNRVYALQSYAELAATAAPAALLIVALAQQILAGSGLEVASTFLSGIQDVVRGASP